MSEMVERVAEAISDVLADTIGLSHKEVTKLMARAAIAAMREPTPDMAVAGAATYGKWWLSGNPVWQAMIDKALEPSSPLSSNKREC